VYLKWNRKLFQEMSAAYRAGRMARDPATFWYKGELSFLDNYIIPLAKKLQDCNIFGVSSDECYNYAIRNRSEWEVSSSIMALSKEALSFLLILTLLLIFTTPHFPFRLVENPSWQRWSKSSSSTLCHIPLPPKSLGCSSVHRPLLQVLAD